MTVTLFSEFIIEDVREFCAVKVQGLCKCTLVLDVECLADFRNDKFLGQSLDCLSGITHEERIYAFNMNLGKVIGNADGIFYSIEGVSKCTPSFFTHKAPTFTSWGFVIT